jgi:hypothetical protein
MSSVRPIRQPAARVELPKAPSTGHPVRRLAEEIVAAAGPELAPSAPEALAVVPPPAAPRREQEAEERRVNFGARVRASVRYRARLWSVQHEVDLQDLLDEALEEYLTRRGG